MSGLPRRATKGARIAWLGMAALLLSTFVVPEAAPAEVLYVHHLEGTRFWTGKEEATLRVAYTEKGIFFDLQKIYLGGWIRRLFGESKKERRSTLILFEPGEIREVAWASDRVYVYPLERLKDVQWITSLATRDADEEKVVSDRYEIHKPRLTVQEMPVAETVAGYSCRRVEARLRLETYDRRKRALSATDVVQTLWLSEQVPGIRQRQALQSRLGRMLGLEAERLGNLGSLLSYWQGSLESIRPELDKVQGYPVKTHVRVTAHYVPKDAPKKKVSKVIKEETIVLQKVMMHVPEDFIEVPSQFTEIRVQ